MDDVIGTAKTKIHHILSHFSCFLNENRTCFTLTVCECRPNRAAGEEGSSPRHRS